MFSCYLKMENRQRVKKDGTQYKIPRYVATMQAGYFRPLRDIKNANGEIVMYHNRNDKCNRNSTSETRLQCHGSINFTSVYLEELKLGIQLIGSGEPPQTKELRSGKENPFYENRQDGYLFIISPDFATIEILIVPQGRQMIRGYAAKLADGVLNDELEQIRKTATLL